MQAERRRGCSDRAGGAALGEGKHSGNSEAPSGRTATGIEADSAITRPSLNSSHNAGATMKCSHHSRRGRIPAVLGGEAISFDEFRASYDAKGEDHQNRTSSHCGYLVTHRAAERGPAASIWSLRCGAPSRSSPRKSNRDRARSPCVRLWSAVAVSRACASLPPHLSRAGRSAAADPSARRAEQSRAGRIGADRSARAPPPASAASLRNSRAHSPAVGRARATLQRLPSRRVTLSAARHAALRERDPCSAHPSCPVPPPMHGCSSKPCSKCSRNNKQCNSSRHNSSSKPDSSSCSNSKRNSRRSSRMQSTRTLYRARPNLRPSSPSQHTCSTRAQAHPSHSQCKLKLRLCSLRRTRREQSRRLLELCNLRHAVHRLCTRCMEATAAR